MWYFLWVVIAGRGFLAGGRQISLRVCDLPFTASHGERAANPARTGDQSHELISEPDFRQSRSCSLSLVGNQGRERESRCLVFLLRIPNHDLYLLCWLFKIVCLSRPCISARNVLGVARKRSSSTSRSATPLVASTVTVNLRCKRSVPLSFLM